VVIYYGMAVLGNYILRAIPDGLWSRFRSRAESEGVSMRALILLLIEAYVDGQVSLSMRQDRRKR